METALFERFRSIAWKQAGIELREGKESLVAARVAKRLRALGLESEEAYLHRLETDVSGEELVQFLDVISTNFTSFFREPEHFELAVAEVERWKASGQKRFRFWSAASSSGEEPYSLAMALADPLGGADWRILATDISTRVLSHASAATYPAHQLRTIPAPLASRLVVRNADGGFTIRPELAEHVVFKRLNLAQPPFPMQGPIDLVLCRNVMIYFDREVRQRLVSEIERLLKPGGLLMTGHSETLNGLRTGLVLLRPSVYRKPEA